jgi:hypothetical protein
MITPLSVRGGFAAILVGVAVMSGGCNSSTASHLTANGSRGTTSQRAIATPSTSIAPAGQATPQPAACPTGSLVFVMGRASGAAGSLVAPFQVRNSSASTCTLTGYFGLELVDAAGHQVGQSPIRAATLVSTSPQPSPVVLHPGEYAAFLFEWGDNPIDGRPCPAAKQVMLTAPDQFDHVLVATQTSEGIAIAPCGSGFTQIGPVTGG